MNNFFLDQTNLFHINPIAMPKQAQASITAASTCRLIQMQGWCSSFREGNWNLGSGQTSTVKEADFGAPGGPAVTCDMSHNSPLDSNLSRVAWPVTRYKRALRDMSHVTTDRRNDLGSCGPGGGRPITHRAGRLLGCYIVTLLHCNAATCCHIASL